MCPTIGSVQVCGRASIVTAGAVTCVTHNISPPPPRRDIFVATISPDKTGFIWDEVCVCVRWTGTRLRRKCAEKSNAHRSTAFAFFFTGRYCTCRLETHRVGARVRVVPTPVEGRKKTPCRRQWTRGGCRSESPPSPPIITGKEWSAIREQRLLLQLSGTCALNS